MPQAIMFGKMIAPIARCKASAGRAEGPKCGRHEPERALAEALERRQLLSAYTLSQVGDTHVNGTGAFPRSAVVADTAGDLFGTTSEGGDHGVGTVFELPAGSHTIVPLASFTGLNDINPFATVTLDSLGNLYGTTSRGGDSGEGSVFEIPKGSTTITTLASFNGTNGGAPISGVTLDSEGNLYGTTTSTVYELPEGSRTIATLASFGSANPSGGVTVDSAGNLYGTTYRAGNGGTVFEIAKGSNAVTTLASFNGASPIGGVTLDSAGNLYGTTAPQLGQ